MGGRKRTTAERDASLEAIGIIQVRNGDALDHW